MRGKFFSRRREGSERGNALVYILIAIALLAALTVTFMEPSSQQTTSQNTFNTVSDLKSQVDFIRAAIQECVLTYPGGDTTIDTSGTGTDIGAVHPYPIKPNSTHFAAATIGPTAGRLVQDIRCPGNPGDDDDHAKIFAGASGKFMPPPVDLFTDWQYYNGADGVFFFTTTDKSDAFVATAMQKLDDQFSECEADVITASGSNEDLTSTATEIECPDGSVCFRVWMVIDADGDSSQVYNGDVDGEEAAATCT